MKNAPGKYNDLATYVREQSGARGVVVIVVDGKKGTGVSVQGLGPTFESEVPLLLLMMAHRIQREQAFEGEHVVRTEHRGFACPCGTTVEMVTGPRAPREGDFSICAFCTRMLRFGKNMVLHEASAAEIASLPPDHRAELVAAQEHLRSAVLAHAMGNPRGSA